MFQHNPCKYVYKRLNKILIILGRTVNHHTQHGHKKVFFKELQFKAGVAVKAKGIVRHWKEDSNADANPPPLPAV